MIKQSQLHDRDPIVDYDYDNKVTSSEAVLVGNINAAVNLRDGQHTIDIWAGEEVGWIELIRFKKQYESNDDVDSKWSEFEWLDKNTSALYTASAIYYGNSSIRDDIPFYEYLNALFMGDI